MDKNQFSLNFELHSLVRDLLKNIWVFILAFLIGFMGCYVYNGYTYKSQYKSSTVLCANRSTGSSTTYSNIQYSKQLASVFSEVFVQNAMKTKAMENIGLTEFNGYIESYVISGTNFIQLTVVSDKPETSFKMLHSLLEVYPQITEKILINSIVTVIQEPDMPYSSMTSLNHNNELKTAVIACLVSILATVVISVMRSTVKDEAGFIRLVDSELIGAVCHERKRNKIKDSFKNVKKSLLIYNSKHVSLPFVESYQKIATRLEYMRRSHGDKVFVLTSVAENEGKSTAASNIAISLASRGNKVLLFDFDLKRPALYKIFDIKKDKNNSNELTDMMVGNVDLSNYLFCRFRKSSLYMALNTKASSEYHSWMEKENVQNVINHFRELVDFIIVDTAPLSVDSTITNILSVADKTILLVRTDVVYASAVNDAILTVKEVGGDFAGCIMNDVYPEVSMFGQTGYDETGYYNKRYGRYSYNKYDDSNPYYRYGGYSEALGLFYDVSEDEDDTKKDNK